MNESTNPTIIGTAGPKAKTMKAVVQHAYGSSELLKVEDIDRPLVQDNEVLIRIRAAAVNQADLFYITGRPLIARLAFGLRKPRDMVRGKDVAGEVEAVGKGVTQFRPGDEVYAELHAGAFAEYASVPEGMLALKPANLTYEQAAAVPLSGRTALQGLRDGGKVQPGHKVLINGASGGVGSFAVQIAKNLGAEVTGVCSTRNAALVRSLGADHVIDYSRENFTVNGQQYDVILDLVGNHSLTALRRVLTHEGTLVLSSGTGGRVFGPMGRILRALLLSPFVSQNLGTFTATRGKEDLDLLRDLIESGKVTPAIDRTYPLSQTREALRYFTEEHARAKIAITL